MKNNKSPKFNQMKKNILETPKAAEFIQFLEEVAKNLGVTVYELRSPARVRPLPDCRKIVVYRLFEAYGNKITAYNISFLLNRDHSSIVTAHKTAKALIQTDKNFHELIKKSYLNPVTMAPQTKTLNELLNDLIRNGAITEAGKIELLKAAAAETFTPIKERIENGLKEQRGTFLSDEN